MKSNFTRTDFILWFLIACYTGLIYATLSIVRQVQKALTESFGYNVFNWIYWVFALLGVALMFLLFRRFKGRQRLRPLISLALIAGIFAYLLTSMDYAVEKIHFLEYGLLGALVFSACKRHLAYIPALLTATGITYWLGLGDEFIQHLLPDRVGEIRDSTINALAGILGIATLSAITYRTHLAANRSQIHLTLQIIFVSALLTSIFLTVVHGFGYKHQTVKAGIIYSSLSMQELDTINTGKTLLPAKMRQYRDEACRHLLQREFYCANDYLGADGSYYRKWDRCGQEQKILEAHYNAFLYETRNDAVGPLLAKYDSEFALKVARNPVTLDPTYRADLLRNSQTRNIYVSRVKSTLITRFTFKDLVFYSALFVIALFWIAGMLPEGEKSIKQQERCAGSD